MIVIVCVLLAVRVRLLLKKGHSCYRPRRTGERKRKSVRGCIVDANMSVLALIVVRKGEKEIAGLTDVQRPRRLGPKRASNIRKLYNLSKGDDVRQYVVRRPLPKKEGKKQRFAAPKIQRLVTPNVLQVSRRNEERKASFFVFAFARDSLISPSSLSSLLSFNQTAQASSFGHHQEASGGRQGAGCRLRQVVGAAQEGVEGEARGGQASSIGVAARIENFAVEC